MSLRSQLTDIDRDTEATAAAYADAARGPVEFLSPAQADAYLDYCADCRADPTGEWLTFDEYFLEWCEAREWEAEERERRQAEEEARAERKGTVGCRVACYDDVDPDGIPF